MLTNQNVHDDRGTSNLDNFLVGCQNKYTNFVADGLWKTGDKTKDLEKNSEIVDLNTHFDNLDKLLLAQKSDKTKVHIAKGRWKVMAPKSGEP